MPLPDGFKVVYEPPKGQAGLPPGFRVVQEPEQSQQGTIADVAGQGAAFGFSDEIAGAVGALAGTFDPRLKDTTFGERYTGIRDAARENADAFSERNPKTALAAEIGGGLLTGGVGAARAGAAKIATSIPKLAATGAGVGGVAGLGHSDAETLQGMAADTALGAGTGAAAGVLLPPVAKQIGRAVTAPVRHMQASRAARPIKKLGEAIARDDLTPEKVGSQLRKMPQGAAIADAGGESVQTLARDITVQPGRARNLARALFEGRRKLAPQRIDNAVRTSLKQTGEFHAARDALEKQMKTAAKPLYEAAYKQPIKMTPTLKAVMDRPAMKEAVKAGQKLANEEGGVIGGNIQMLDYAKRALDDKIGVAMRAGKNQKARSLIGTKNALLKEMDAQVPVYGQARAAYSGPKAMEDALESGRKFLREDAESIVKAVRDMSPAEKEFFRMGAIRELRDKVLSKSDTANAYRAIFDSPLKREKIRALFPDSKSFVQFSRAMQGEAKMYETGSKAMANSSTANKLAGVDDLKLSPDILVDATTGSPVMAAINATKTWLRRAAPTIKNEKMRNELAEMLFNADPATQQKILKQIGVPVTAKALNDAPLAIQGAVAGSEIAVSRLN